MKEIVRAGPLLHTVSFTPYIVRLSHAETLRGKVAILLCKSSGLTADQRFNQLVKMLCSCAGSGAREEGVRGARGAGPQAQRKDCVARGGGAHRAQCGAR